MMLYNDNEPTQRADECWPTTEQGATPMGTATYSYLRENLAEVWDEVEETQEPIIVTRKGHQDLAILPAEELAVIRETAYLLRSPKNARRLMEALVRAYNGEGVETTVDALRTDLGLTAKTPPASK
jgi:antitoxin YefM